VEGGRHGCHDVLQDISRELLCDLAALGNAGLVRETLRTAQVVGLVGLAALHHD
jgi:hypothetical protein